MPGKPSISEVIIELDGAAIIAAFLIPLPIHNWHPADRETKRKRDSHLECSAKDETLREKVEDRTNENIWALCLYNLDTLVECGYST